MTTTRARLATFFAAGLAFLAGCRGEPGTPGHAPESPDSPPRVVIVDSDLGPDDWIALLALLREPTVEVRAITVAPGYIDCATALSHLRRLEVAAGHSPVPKACGAQRPMDGGRLFPKPWRDDAAGLLGVDAPPDPQPGKVDTNGVRLLIRTVRDADGPVTLLALGALTNVALALDSLPDMPRRVQRLVAMLGSLEAPGNVTAADDPGASGKAEWNARVDPRAADRVLGAGFDVTLVGLDATSRVPVDSTVVARLAAAGPATPALTFVVGVLEAQTPMIQAGQYQLWDPLAAAEAVHPGVVHTRSVALAVTAAGPDAGALHVVQDRPPARVAVDADGPRALSWLERTLAGNQP